MATPDTLTLGLGAVTALALASSAALGTALLASRRAHRRALRALTASEMRFRAASDASLDALFILTAERDGQGVLRGFRCDDLNARAVEFLGLGRPSIVGRRLHECLEPLPGRWLARTLTRVVTSGAGFEGELPIDVDGIEACWIRLQVVPLGDGVAVSVRDVTAARVAEGVLREKEALYRILARNFPNGAVLLFDRELRYRIAEGAGLAQVHLKREELEGRTIWEVFPPETSAVLAPQYQAALAGRASTDEVAYDGSTFLRMVVPVRNDAGAVVAGLIVTQDITDRKQAELALAAARDQAEAASRAKSEFLARMSHELRTPLNSVIGFANVVRKNRQGALGPAELTYLERITANGRHLLGLIDEILDLSKIEAGRLHVAREPVALDALVRETVESFAAQLQGRDVTLATELPAALAPIETDPGRVRQVLLNLVGNALKFTPQGRVVVRLEADPVTRRPLRLDVADTGIGIPPERQRAIFEAFEQADPGTTRAYGGTGLGLTISRSLCEALGYRLDVTSTPGAGSTFSVDLRPAEPPRAAA